MSPSSLIFVAVIAIWTTYLVVHVARRREHLATARTVDRFSSQMRVLQRRAVRVASQAPVAEQGRPSSRPLRTRPLVAATSADSFVGRSFGARSQGDPTERAAADASVTGPTATGDSDTTDTRVLQVQAVAQARTGTDAAACAPAVAADDQAQGSEAEAGVESSVYRKRRVRAAALLLALATTVMTGALAAFGVLTWAAPVAAAAAVVGVLWWLRVAATSERAARHRAAAVARRERDRAVLHAREAALEARPSAPVLPVAQEHVEPRAEVYDDRAGEARTQVLTVADTGVLAVVDPLLGDREWAPTPVPPPTYTLKARAERPMPEPLDVPVPIEVDDQEITWDERRNQPRAVNG